MLCQSRNPANDLPSFIFMAALSQCHLCEMVDFSLQQDELKCHAFKPHMLCHNSATHASHAVDSRGSDYPMGI